MRPLIVGNWKMNTTLSDALVLANYIKEGFEFSNIDAVLCPPYLWIYPIAELYEKGLKNLLLGAQNVYYDEEGANTGEVSPKMLKNLVDYVIIGHSERRKHFAEGVDLINKKIISSINNNLKPIVCVGEDKKMKLESGDFNRTTGVDINAPIFEDLKSVLNGVSAQKITDVIIAYEPVWAIGTGEPATGAYAAEIITGIREKLAEKYGKDTTSKIQIIYGGSVNLLNAAEFLHQPEIDGLLIGGASLKAKEFLGICKIADS